MACDVEANLDPRVRRTRVALATALGTLLESKDFEKISVGDIAEAATLNRATFYDHYPDKFALLEAMVGMRFQALLDARGTTYDGTCASGPRAIILGVCDYLAATPRLECERQRQMEPHLESAVIAVVRRLILAGVMRHASERSASPELIATTVSWAIFGAAKEWIRTPNRCQSEAIVETIASLVTPLLRPAGALVS